MVHHEYGHHLVNVGGSGQGQYGEGMSDVMGEERKPLTGVAARIYDIVRQDELLAEEER